MAKIAGTCMTGFVAAVTVVGLVVGGCTAAKSQPTPIVVVVTASPAPSATHTPSVTPTPLPTPPATPMESATPEPPTAPPVAPAVPATTCTGSADNQAFLADVASKMAWDVYCPVLPSGWYLTDGNYEQPNGGKLKLLFTGPGGATIEVDEGSFCLTDMTTCAPSAGNLGSANFGDLSGSLDSLPGGSLGIHVAPGTNRAYTLIGMGVTQDSFVSIAAALVKVAKS